MKNLIFSFVAVVALVVGSVAMATDCHNQAVVERVIVRPHVQFVEVVDNHHRQNNVQKVVVQRVVVDNHHNQNVQKVQKVVVRDNVRVQKNVQVRRFGRNVQVQKIVR